MVLGPEATAERFSDRSESLVKMEEAGVSAARGAFSGGRRFVLQI